MEEERVSLRLRRSELRTERPPRGAVLGSAGVHSVFLLVALFATTAPDIPALPLTYRVRMVAISDPDAPLRVDPAPPQTAEEEYRPPPPEPSPEPLPETAPPTVEEELTPVEEPEPEPARTDEVGEEAINVQLDGAVFAFPAYLENIIRQIGRYWRPPAGGRALRAEVEFVIHRDGSVTDIDWVSRSGDPTFDLGARGAVERAGRDLAFGPLPDLYPRDRLRVTFFFDPSTR